MNYNTKDIFLQRRTANGTFEEHPLAVQPNTVVIINSNNDIDLTSVNSLVSGTDEFNITSSWAMNSISTSYISASNIDGNVISSSYALTASCILNGIYAGMVSTPSIVDDTSSLQVYIGAGTVNLFSNSSGVGAISQFALTPTTFSLSTGLSSSFLYATSNGITASYGITDSFSYINGTSITHVATLYRDDTDVHTIELDNPGLALANKLQTRLIETDKFSRVDGFSLSEVGTRQFLITAGSVWYGATKHSASTFDSRITQSIDTPIDYDEVHFLYHSESQWVNPIVVDGKYNNLYYDDGANLAPLAPLSYSVNYLYRILGDNVYDNDTFVLPSNYQYSDLASAKLDIVPKNIPTVLEDVSLLIGRIVFQSGSGAAAAVESAFNVNFGQSLVTQHNGLGGLQGGSGGQYYHLNSAEYIGTGTGVFVKTTDPTLNYSHVSIEPNTGGVRLYDHVWNNELMILDGNEFSIHYSTITLADVEFIPNKVLILDGTKQIQTSTLSVADLEGSYHSGSSISASGVFSNLSINAPSITSSLYGTASWSNNSLNSINNLSSSYASQSRWSISSSFASSSMSASYLMPSTGAYAITSSWAVKAASSTSASFASSSVSASYLSGATAIVNNLTSTRGAQIGGTSNGNASTTTVQIGYGLSTTNTNLNSVQIGYGVGNGNPNSDNAVQIGYAVGQNAKTSSYAVQIGFQAAAAVTSALSSVQIGANAGLFSRYADYAIQIGNQAGYNATNAINSCMIGANAGYDANNSDYSTFIGSNADALSSTLNVTKSIAIGYNAKVSGSNMAVIGGTGVDAVKVGIGTNNPVNTLEVVGNISASSFTGSVQGIATSAINSIISDTSLYASQSQWAVSSSFASSSLSASYVTASNVYGTVTSASYSLSASYGFSSSFSLSSSFITASNVYGTVTSASYSLSSSYTSTSSYSLSSSYITASNVYGTVTSASYSLTSSYGFSSSYSLTSSYITASNVYGTVTSASYSLTSSYITASNVYGTVTSASYSLTSSYGFSSSYSLTSSYITASGVNGTVTSASYSLSASYGISASYASTASNSKTSSYITASNVYGTVTSASYSLTASYALAGVGGGITQPGSYNISASYASGSISASYAATASYILGGSVVSVLSASWASMSLSSSYATDFTASVGIYTPKLYLSDTSVNLGFHAGNQSTSAYTVLIGNKAGESLTSEVDNVIFIGDMAGQNVTSGGNATLIGFQAANLASKALGNICIGYQAGYDVTGAGTMNYSTFIGYEAGIRNALPEGNYDNSIAIGRGAKVTGQSQCVIGSTAGDAFAVNVGIGTYNPQHTLEVVGNISASSITASLLGTASYALTASYITASNVYGTVTSASYSLTASYALSGIGGGVTQPGSYNISASWASSSFNSLHSTQSLFATQSIYSTQSLFSTQSKFSTQSLFSTQSIYSTQSLFATQSIYSTQSIQSTSSISSSWASSSLSSSYASTASWAYNIVGGGGTGNVKSYSYNGPITDAGSDGFANYAAIAITTLPISSGTALHLNGVIGVIYSGSLDDPKYRKGVSCNPPTGGGAIFIYNEGDSTRNIQWTNIDLGFSGKYNCQNNIVTIELSASFDFVDTIPNGKMAATWDGFVTTIPLPTP